MLTAAINGKIKRRARFWEDEVTSIVFGSLKFLNNNTLTWEFISSLLNICGHSSLLSRIATPDNVKFDFWPRWKPANSSGISTIEPDLVIRFSENKSPTLNILIEIKWDSGISPKCELLKQWAHKDHPDEKWVHLYITKHMSYSNEDVNQSLTIAKHFNGCHPDCCNKSEENNYHFGNIDIQHWEKHLVPATWQQVALAASELCKDEWAESVSIFLQRQGVIPFTGFHDLDGPEIPKTNSVFYTIPPWFKIPPANEIPVQVDTLFYNDTFPNSR